LENDFHLASLSEVETELVARSFLSFFRDFGFHEDGRPKGKRRKPVVSSSVRDAAGSVAASFRGALQQSPFHLPNSTILHPAIKSLLKAYEQLDAPKNRQKALTPKFFKRLFETSGAGDHELLDTPQSIAAELVVAAWFFAMRGCEFTYSRRKGKTKPICPSDVVFRDENRKIIKHSSDRTHEAEYVTLTFRDQKNGNKMDSRSQQRTESRILCPIRRWSSIVQRQRRMGIKDTQPVYTVRQNKKTQFITTTFVKNILRTTCRLFGAKDEFGFDPSEIGIKSIRSAAAMSLFLADHSTPKIMILGRWSSDAFLDYIRPQVLEWTSSMSRDMIKTDHFVDVGLTRKHPKSDPRKRKTLKTFNGSKFLMPSFNIHH
jgi:hypothetical protein